jgi:hypothetical protein
MLQAFENMRKSAYAGSLMGSTVADGQVENLRHKAAG